MGLLGGEYTHESWGRDLLRVKKDDSGYAVINVLNRVGWLEPDLYYYEYIGQPGVLLDRRELADSIRDITEERPDDFARLQRRLHLYLQAAEQLSTPAGIE